MVLEFIDKLYDPIDSSHILRDCPFESQVLVRSPSDGLKFLDNRISECDCVVMELNYSVAKCRVGGYRRIDYQAGLGDNLYAAL